MIRLGVPAHKGASCMAGAGLRGTGSRGDRWVLGRMRVNIGRGA